MIEINLVPDVKQELIKAQRARSLVISGSILVGIVSVGVVAILAGWVFGVQAVRGAQADSAIKTGDQKLQSNGDLSKILTIQNQLTKLTDLNDSKTIDSRIFDVLAAIIPPSPNEVQISDLGIDDASTTITIQGQAANSYQALEVFKKTISGTNITFDDQNGTSQTEALASAISTDDVTYGQDASGATVLRFTLSFNFPTDLFSPLSSNLKVVPADTGNATDSYLGLPQDLFVDRATDIGGSK